ncbi:MAG TPA: glycoside hydrolase family 3 C-terminal domain-containing protein, partial [Acidimicrobiia bacterium]
SGRALREVYLSQFEAIVAEAAPASVMCAYSTVNGEPACQNAALLANLKTDWAFPGFVTSDWYAAKSVEAASAGLDLEMPAGFNLGAPLGRAIARGTVPRERLDDMVRRVLTQMFRFGMFDGNPPGDATATVTTDAHAAVAREVAAKGTVLLKNSGAVLPVEPDTVGSIAVIGAGAGTAALTRGEGSAEVEAPYVVTPAQAIAERARADAMTATYAPGNRDPNLPIPAVPASAFPQGLGVEYFDNESLSGEPIHAAQMPAVAGAAMPPPDLATSGWSARYTGTILPPESGSYAFVLDADPALPSTMRLRIDGRVLVDSGGARSRSRVATVDLSGGEPVSLEIEYAETGTNGGGGPTLGWNLPTDTLEAEAVELAARSDVAVVFAGSPQGESEDLLTIGLPGDVDRLIAAVGAANPRTVVVLNTGSAVAMPWIDDVAAVVEAWYPGQEYGSAIASVLFGDVNPSGKLPVTFPRGLADVPASRPEQWPGTGGMVDYAEGLLVGYRWYDANGIAPLFPFGAGLSYTTFAFEALEIHREDSTVSVEARVTNVGSRTGAEIAQVYVGYPGSPGEPPRQLRGFERAELDRGEAQRVRFQLDETAFARWDEQTRAWLTETGEYRIMVGSSSVDLPLEGSVRIR